MTNQKLNNLLKDPRTNWKYIGMVVILAVIAGAVSLWCLTKKEPLYQPPELKKPEKVSFEQLSTCNADLDCVLVTHKSCGGVIKISINKKYESQYNSTSKFQDSTGEVCKTLGVSHDEQRQIIEGQVPTESLCVSNKCIPKYLVDETAGWKAYQNLEKGITFNYPDSYQVEDDPATGGVRLRQFDSNWGSDSAFLVLEFSDHSYTTCCGAAFNPAFEETINVKKESTFLCGVKVARLTYDGLIEQADASRKSRNILFYTDKSSAAYSINFPEGVTTKSISAVVVRDAIEELDKFSQEIDHIVSSLRCQ